MPSKRLCGILYGVKGVKTLVGGLSDFFRLVDGGAIHCRLRKSGPLHSFACHRAHLELLITCLKELGEQLQVGFLYLLEVVLDFRPDFSLVKVDLGFI